MNPGGQGLGLIADTINLALAPCNSAPVWNAPPPHYVPMNQVSNFDMSATDPDGDKVYYSLIPPLGATLSSVIYNNGYAWYSPLGGGWAVSLNLQSGLLSVYPMPGSWQKGVVGVRAYEWRNNQRIGTIMRDFELASLNALPCNNAVPTVGAPTNFWNCDYINGEIWVAPGDSMCFDVSSTDPDLGNVGNLSWMRDLDGGSLTDTFGNGPDTVSAVGPWARVCWRAPSQFVTDTATITVIDPTCQLNNMQVLFASIRVGDPRLVWPGDANEDFVADAFDLLPIGIAYGNTGFPRVGASNSWIGQQCNPWQDTILGGLDKKFIDCDGSGTINDDDTLAITLNYGSVHTKADMPTARGTLVDPPLKLILPDSANVGDTIDAPIVLGDAVVMANNIYGWAFRLHYDAALIDSSTFWIDFSPSWVAAGGQSLDLAHNEATLAHCDAAQVRTTHTTVSGMGQIGRAHFVIIDNIDGKREAVDSSSLNLFFSDVRIIGLNGEVIAVDAQPDSIMVYDYTVDNGQHFFGNGDIQIFPNPAKDVLTVQALGEVIESVEVSNMQGQVVHRELPGVDDKFALRLEAFAHGMYFVRVKTGLQTQVMKLIIE
jgi:hypothetical protein